MKLFHLFTMLLILSTTLSCQRPNFQKAKKIPPIVEVQKKPPVIIPTPVDPPKEEPIAPQPAPVPRRPVSPARIALAWEKTTQEHPERIPWSDSLIAILDQNLDELSKAKDIGIFCPKYFSLDRQQKLKAWGEFWVADALFESGYNPNDQNVDVGEEDKPETWSIGLWSMSVRDQISYRLPFGFSFQDLLRPENNAKLAVAVMVIQIQKRDLIVVPSRPYWSTLYHGKYDRVFDIASRVKRFTGFCEQVYSSGTPSPLN